MKDRTYPFYFVIVALLLYGVFFVLPSIMGFYYAFTDWNSYTTEINWVGFDNFTTIFTSTKSYVSYIRNTVVFTVSTIFLKTVLALGMAILLTDGVRRFRNFYRAIMYLPY